MKSFSFQPESFQYFLNSQIFYVAGVNLESITEEGTVILKSGSECQLVFKASTLNFDKEALFKGERLLVNIEDYIRSCKIKGRTGSRLTVISFDEDDIWRNV